MTMRLSRRVPARTKTIEFRWLSSEFMEMSQQFRRIRSGLRNKMDKCHWCGHAFEDGEQMGLGNVVGVGGNKVFCQACVAEAQASEENHDG